MKPVGVVAALWAEGAILAGPGRESCRFLKLPRDVWLALAGGGRERAGTAAEELLSRGAGALVSWGTAGGLARGLPAGALLLPTAVVGQSSDRFPILPSWRERLGRRLEGRVAVFGGDLYTPEQVVPGSRAKARLSEETGALGIDTESAAVAAAASEADVPFVAVRAVVDPVGFSLPRVALAAVDEDGRTRLSRLLAALALAPWELPELCRLTAHYRAARKTLRTVVACAGRRLLFP